jgi:hypothetical protein
MASKGHPKPLHGAKKYDKVKLACTVAECDNEFYVSLATTPAKRQCAEHFQPTKTTKVKRPFVPTTVEHLIGLMYN